MIKSIEWAWPSFSELPGHVRVIKEFLSYDMQIGCLRWDEKDLTIANCPTILHWSRKFEWPWVVINSGVTKEDHVLDAGSGDSILKYALAARAKKVTVVDINTDQFDDIKDEILFPEFGNIDLVGGRIQELPFADNTFDMTCCVSVLEHTDHYFKCVDELIRVTKPGKPVMISMDIALENPTHHCPVTVPLAIELVRQHGAVFPEINEKTMTWIDPEMYTKVAVLCFKIEKPITKTIKCDYCDSDVAYPELGQSVDCKKCGQKMFHNPCSGLTGEPYIGGCYKSCCKCGKLIKDCFVSYSQHFHDECAPDEIKFLGNRNR